MLIQSAKSRLGSGMESTGQMIRLKKKKNENDRLRETETENQRDREREGGKAYRLK